MVVVRMNVLQKVDSWTATHNGGAMGHVGDKKLPFGREMVLVAMN
jgi:hypothetical protein